MTSHTPQILEYGDYREYLRSYYTYKKREGRGFSFRYFSRRVGLRSPNYLKLVMDGQRNLTAEMAERFTKALDLAGDEATYFVELVAHSQAKSESQRQRHNTRLLALRAQGEVLAPLHAEYFSVWYVQAIERMAGMPSFEGTPAWVATTMVPPIREDEASHGLRVLLLLGLFVRNTSGALERSETPSPNLLASIRAGF